jgi:asparagine synthase (glutamine-hydrolysing)
MEVILKHNEGYKWTTIDGVSFKGYFVTRSTNNVLKGEDAVKALSEIYDMASLLAFLKEQEGSFAIVIDHGDFKAMAVDRARSMPLFFSQDGTFVSDSAEEIRIKLGIAKEDVDETYYKAFFAKTYLFGDVTVYSSIKQLDLCTVGHITENGVIISRYYKHSAKVLEGYSDKELIKMLEDTSIRVFERLKKVINGRPIVLSMSGGYDSRYVGCMLKKVGVEDVSCYTYGKIGSFEVTQSKKNAEALGYRWICVDYTDDVIKRTLDDLGRKYIDSFDTHDYTAYLQNFPAVRELSEKGWFKPGSVFITGLCGDMPTGEYVPSYNDSVTYDNSYAKSWIYKYIYERRPIDWLTKSKWDEYIVEKMHDLCINVDNFNSFVSALDEIYTMSDHSHCFLNMNRAHEFFGYEWLTPYWDTELLNLWYSIPAKYRYKQGLYEQFLLDDLCSVYGIGQRKTVVGYSKNIVKKRIQYLVGGSINWILLHVGIPFKRKYDYNNWAPLELMLWQNLPSKKTVVYQKAGLINLLTQYSLQKRYGVANMINAKQSFDNKQKNGK